MNRLYNLIYRIYYGSFNKVITFFEIAFLRIRGVKIANNCSFRGWASFHLSNQSKIIVGTSCRFNSRTSSNRIGINHKCMISTLQENAELIIGSGCGFSGVSIGCFEKIIIGNNVRVGANVLITDSDWHLDDARVSKPKPILIEDNVWLGYGVVIMKGVTIGENTIIGINSVVIKDIPANVVAGGNPCHIIKEISNESIHCN